MRVSSFCLVSLLALANLQLLFIVHAMEYLYSFYSMLTGGSNSSGVNMDLVVQYFQEIVALVDIDQFEDGVDYDANGTPVDEQLRNKRDGIKTKLMVELGLSPETLLQTFRQMYASFNDAEKEWDNTNTNTTSQVSVTVATLELSLPGTTMNGETLSTLEIIVQPQTTNVFDLVQRVCDEYLTIHFANDRSGIGVHDHMWHIKKGGNSRDTWQEREDWMEKASLMPRAIGQEVFMMLMAHGQPGIDNTGHSPDPMSTINSLASGGSGVGQKTFVGPFIQQCDRYGAQDEVSIDKENSPKVCDAFGVLSVGSKLSLRYDMGSTKNVTLTVTAVE